MSESIAGSIIAQRAILHGRMLIASPTNLRGSMHIPPLRDRDPYEGSYSIVPKIAEQVLATQDKRMTDNLTVQEITYQAVSNEHGGKTIIIGGNE